MNISLTEGCPISPDTNQHDEENRSPAFRIGMRTLLLLVTGCSILVAYFTYYRSASRTVQYEFHVIESSRLSELELHSIEDSPYSWVMVDDQQLNHLLTTDQGAKEALWQKSSQVHMWPFQAEGTTFFTPWRFLDVVDPNQDPHAAKVPVSDSGMLNGFLGIRRAGTSLQLRVEARAYFDRPDDDAKPSYEAQPREKVEGSIFYEGKAPQGALLFVAPLDDEEYHAIVFTILKK